MGWDGGAAGAFAVRQAARWCVEKRRGPTDAAAVRAAAYDPCAAGARQFKIPASRTAPVLDREGAGRIIDVVARRWSEIAGDPSNKAFSSLPGQFWMNAAGGRAGGGKWVTVLMYTENDADADAFRAVLQRWQARGSGAGGQGRGQEGSGSAAPDLIQIRRPGGGAQPAAQGERPPADAGEAGAGAVN